jgi:hypothetical protein
MEIMLDAHFSDRSPTGLVRLFEGGEVAETYFDALGDGIYVPLPSLFVAQNGKSLIAGGGEERLNDHMYSNSLHTQETLNLLLEGLKNKTSIRAAIISPP